MSPVKPVLLLWIRTRLCGVISNFGTLWHALAWLCDHARLWPALVWMFWFPHEHKGGFCGGFVAGVRPRALCSCHESLLRQTAHELQGQIHASPSKVRLLLFTDLISLRLKVKVLEKIQTFTRRDHGVWEFCVNVIKFFHFWIIFNHVS